MSRDDSDEIHRRLNDELENILDRYWSGWITEKRKGQDIALLTPRVKEKGRKPTSSFTCHLSGPDRGKWFRFSIGEGGGILGLLYYGDTGNIPRSKSDWADAYKIARMFLGIEERRQETPEEAAEREKRISAQKEQREREAAQREAVAAAAAAEKEQTVKEIWRGTISLQGTHGEAYLVERGLPPISEWPWNPDLDLRFHPSLSYGSGGHYPAIVGRVAEPFNGSGTGIWRIFLDRKEPRKADVPSAKLGLGPAVGGAVRIGGMGSWIGIAEGIESALAGWFLWDCRRPVWAGLSTSGVSGFEPPMQVDRITIIPDGDKGMMGKDGIVQTPPGLNAALKLQEKMKIAGIRCDISDMTNLGDALDLLQIKRKYEQEDRNTTTSNQFGGRENRHREGAAI